MSFWLWGVLLAFLGGCLVCTVNFFISRYILLNKAALFSATTVVRQILNVGYLVILYVTAPHTPWDLMYLLIGGALGITLPMILFTARLVKLSEHPEKKPADSAASDGEVKKNG